MSMGSTGYYILVLIYIVQSVLLETNLQNKGINLRRLTVRNYNLQVEMSLIKKILVVLKTQHYKMRKKKTKKTKRSKVRKDRMKQLLLMKMKLRKKVPRKKKLFPKKWRISQRWKNQQKKIKLKIPATLHKRRQWELTLMRIQVVAIITWKCLFFMCGVIFSSLLLLPSSLLLVTILYIQPLSAVIYCMIL